ncbi:SMI1/KNR4 family protein [Pseudoduganella armeniaca]|uniref:SMI1/KNR4 family protein n=1 Tax=Pseudoduganella armeniaca TaxID=2072590 RepID=UPI0011B1E158|nr:SMI1/KNR4 family protein [Pseudoduganella armeniaca]
MKVKGSDGEPLALPPEAALPPGSHPLPGGLPRAWLDLATEIPRILAFLSSAVHGIYLVPGDAADSLMYAYTVSGEPCFCHGRQPLAGPPPRFAALWPQLPESLRRFYLDLHDGWTFALADSMGPLPVADWAFLSDDRFDIDAHTARRMPVDPGRVLAVFQNGAGDYLCLHVPEDGVTPASGMIWWHEQPAALEAVDFMVTLDAWIGLFVDEANRRRP